MTKRDKRDKRKAGAPDPAKTQAARDRRKASYIRTRVRDGATVTDDDRTFLAEYDARPHGNAAPAPDPSEAPAPAPDPSGAPDPDAPAPSFELPAAPPPPPARTVRDMVKDSRKGAPRWQDNYHGSIGDPGQDAREATCVFVASYWHGALMEMNRDIEASGGRPIIDIDTDEMRGLFVRAVDDIAPPEMTLTPTMIAVGATTGTIVQRFVRHKAITASKAARPISTSAPHARPDDQPAARPSSAAPSSAPAPRARDLVPERASADESDATIAAAAAATGRPIVPPGKVEARAPEPAATPGRVAEARAAATDEEKRAEAWKLQPSSGKPFNKEGFY